jgi:uncharacterized RDD family membrane protein YckC
MENMRAGLPTGAIVGAFILPAIAFALAYFPIVTRLSRGLVSAYAKADVTKRLLAATTDAVIVVAGCRLYWSSGAVTYLAVAAAYVLLRDSVRGQSIGKLLCGLVVISLETGRPATFATSFRRNAVLMLPGANVVAVFLEGLTIVRDPQGQRLGDRLAQTQVVDGFGARDLVKSFQDWLMSLGADSRRAAGRRRRAPVRVDRAA